MLTVTVPPGAVLDGIAEQIVEDLHQTPGVGPHPGEIIGYLGTKSDAGVLGCRFRSL